MLSSDLSRDHQFLAEGPSSRLHMNDVDSRRQMFEIAGPVCTLDRGSVQYLSVGAQHAYGALGFTTVETNVDEALTRVGVEVEVGDRIINVYRAQGKPLESPVKIRLGEAVIEGADVGADVRVAVVEPCIRIPRTAHGGHRLKMDAVAAAFEGEIVVVHFRSGRPSQFNRTACSSGIKGDELYGQGVNA